MLERHQHEGSLRRLATDKGLSHSMWVVEPGMKGA